ncbi:MAG: hypothetical protein ACKOAS_00365 [Verrucomicrobiota bacterium]
MNLRLLLLSSLLCVFALCLQADDRVAIVRSNGLLVFLPEVGGPDTYGTYLVPNELGRAELDRFLHLGNPLQINFLPASELPEGFSGMSNPKKLEAFFAVESRHLSESFNQGVVFADFKPTSVWGVDYLTGTASFVNSDGRNLEIRITARTAGEGILHAAFQPENTDSIAKTRAMVNRLLSSFELVRRPLTPDELEKRSKEAK